MHLLELVKGQGDRVGNFIKHPNQNITGMHKKMLLLPVFRNSTRLN